MRGLTLETRKLRPRKLLVVGFKAPMQQSRVRTWVFWLPALL